MIKFFQKSETDKYIIIKILFIKITFKKKPTKSDLYDFENRINDKIEKIRYNNYLLNMSKNIDYNTFLKYKNINQGKEIVLIATGPTLNKYIPIENALNVGVNQAIYYDKVKLDYYFLQDCKNSTKDIPEFIIKNNDGKCKYFFGTYDMEYMKDIVSESDSILIKNSERYIVDILCSYNNLIYDITSLPLQCFGSVVFAAIRFIFWTNPKRIYLVGCDATNSGHFNQKNNTLDLRRVKLGCDCSAGGHFVDNKDTSHYGYMLYGWNQAKLFLSYHYPDIEIISINPIGLKGMFKDIYSKELKYFDYDGNEFIF